LDNFPYLKKKTGNKKEYNKWKLMQKFMWVPLYWRIMLKIFYMVYKIRINK